MEFLKVILFAYKEGEIDTEQAIKMIDALPIPQSRYMADGVFQRMQYEIRHAFECGARAMKPDQKPAKALAYVDGDPKEKGEWYDHWLECDSRKFLMSKGFITGDEGYK